MDTEEETILYLISNLTLKKYLVKERRSTERINLRRRRKDGGL